MVILVRMPSELRERLIRDATVRQGNIYRRDLARMIGASKGSIDGKYAFYLVSAIKLCGLAGSDLAETLRNCQLVSQRGAVTRKIVDDGELKQVIDKALGGFQMLIEESFRIPDRETENDKSSS